MLLLASVGALNAAQPFKGRIVKLDPTNGKVTLTHGAILKLDMPAGMTMGYRVADPAMSKWLAVGDGVAFDAKDDGCRYTINDMGKSE